MKSAKLSIVFYSVLSAAALGLHQKVTAEPELAPAEPVDRLLLAPAADPADDEQEVQVERRREGRKEIRIERRGRDGRVIEERIIGGGEGPDEGDAFERRGRPFEGPGERPEMRRFFRKAPEGEGDVIIRRFPGDREERLEVRPRRNFRGPDARPGRKLEIEERAEHLEQAIHHLREAGLNDVADRLEERLEQLRQRRREMEPAFGELREQLDHLRQEQDQLREELQKLKKALRDEQAKKPREEQ